MSPPLDCGCPDNPVLAKLQEEWERNFCESVPQWLKEEWGPCFADNGNITSCGAPGHQIREVTCSTGDDTDCELIQDEVRPASTRICNLLENCGWIAEVVVPCDAPSNCTGIGMEKLEFSCNGEERFCREKFGGWMPSTVRTCSDCTVGNVTMEPSWK